MEIHNSKINKINKTISINGAKTEDNKVKYENIYIIIWPLERLVLKRIIKVKGRISWEKISTKGKKSIKPDGEP